MRAYEIELILKCLREMSSHERTRLAPLLVGLIVRSSPHPNPLPEGEGDRKISFQFNDLGLMSPVHAAASDASHAARSHNSLAASGQVGNSN
jgi:hypothetical protein